jgi:hypothetical protein
MAKIEKHTRRRDIAEGKATAETAAAKRAASARTRAAGPGGSNDWSEVRAHSGNYKGAKKRALKDINASLAANEKVKNKLGVPKPSKSALKAQADAKTRRVRNEILGR